VKRQAIQRLVNYNGRSIQYTPSSASDRAAMMADFAQTEEAAKNCQKCQKAARYSSHRR